MEVLRRLRTKRLSDAVSGAAKLDDFTGGAERGRTVGLLNAIQALSQLSYSPTAGKKFQLIGTVARSQSDKATGRSRPARLPDVVKLRDVFRDDLGALIGRHSREITRD